MIYFSFSKTNIFESTLLMDEGEEHQEGVLSMVCLCYHSLGIFGNKVSARLKITDLHEQDTGAYFIKIYRLLVTFNI